MKRTTELSVSVLYNVFNITVRVVGYSKPNGSGFKHYEQLAILLLCHLFPIEVEGLYIPLAKYWFRLKSK